MKQPIQDPAMERKKPISLLSHGDDDDEEEKEDQDEELPTVQAVNASQGHARNVHQSNVTVEDVTAMETKMKELQSTIIQQQAS